MNPKQNRKAKLPPKAALDCPLRGGICLLIFEVHY